LGLDEQRGCRRETKGFELVNPASRERGSGGLIDNPHCLSGARDIDLLLLKAFQQGLVYLDLCHHKIIDAHPGLDREGDE
jgi:hypothetical protein